MKLLEKIDDYLGEATQRKFGFEKKKQKKVTDMTGKKCKKKGCGGKYKETSQMDDMDGVLHCSKCNDRVQRYQ